MSKTQVYYRVVNKRRQQISENVKNGAFSPQEVGPGYWSVIHRGAAKAKTRHEQEKFVKEFRGLSDMFPCEMCRNHWKKYMLDSPPERAIGGKGANGLFAYTWTFHNAVNKRIGKKIMNWADAKALYF